jgi:Methyl-accepting chemotaxis protein (MCP) signalling domain
MDEEHATAGHAAGNRGDLLRRTEELSREVTHLKTLAIAFERWHEDMIRMTARARDMNVKGDDLATIARHMIMVSMNASIEAARAGDIARGFVVVAAEVKNQAKLMQTLSGDMGKDLHKSELMTTATFQDIQAGGKMMMAAISGLESMVKQLRLEIG